MRLAIVAAAGLAALSTAILSTAAVAASSSNPALSPAPARGTGLPSGQCIRGHDIRNHTIADSRTLLIDYNGKATYRVTMSGACLAGAVSSDPIVTREPPGRSMICKPIDMDVSISKGGFTTPCIVDSIVKMTPAEVAALPRRLKP
jgi:hypothetical protein